MSIESLITEKNQLAANNFYLNGIATGMKIWETDLYKNVESVGAKSILIPDGNYKLYINQIRIDLESKAGKHYKSVMWYSVSKEDGDDFTEDDFKKINSVLEERKEEQYGCQFSCLAIFTENPSDADKATKLITGVGKIFARNIVLKKMIMGIAIAKSDDKEKSNPGDET